MIKTEKGHSHYVQSDIAACGCQRGPVWFLLNNMSFLLMQSKTVLE